MKAPNIPIGSILCENVSQYVVCYNIGDEAMEHMSFIIKMGWMFVTVVLEFYANLY